MADVWTVMWKELFTYRFSKIAGMFSLLLLIGVSGVFLPLQVGSGWVTSPQAVIVAAWMPLYLVTSVTADSFAGERERHTLETLLASRLSDATILLGKVGSAAGYGWGLTLISMLVGLAAVNLANPEGGLLLFPASVGMSIVGFSLLGAGLAAGAGVLVSLRASSVRQAQQTLGIVVMMMLFLPIFGLSAVPLEWRERISTALIGLDPTWILLLAACGLALLDAA